MLDEYVPGAYTVLNEQINIRTQMNTLVTSNVVGAFKNGEPFTVFEVYPEDKGIVWGRVSSNTGGGQARFVALRVNNHPKVRLERAFAGTTSDLVTAVNGLTNAVTTLTGAIKESKW